MTKKLTWLLAGAYALLCCGVHTASAIPAYPHPITVTQSDGTRITVQIYGDEYKHYTVTKDGYTVVGGPNNDYYFARLGSDGSLVPTEVMAKPLNQLSTAERTVVTKLAKNLQPLTSSVLRAPRNAQGATRGTGSSVAGNEAPGRISTAPTIGKLRSLVILVEFPTLKFSVKNPKESFTNMLMQEGYNHNDATGSARDYYIDNSNGQFNPQFDVVGPYLMPRDVSYYAGASGSDNVARLAVEACKQAEAAGIDFSQYSDDGKIRDVFMFYAGYSKAENSNVQGIIWPHRSESTASPFGIFGGMKLYAYACSSEYGGQVGSNKMAGIGAFCHEFGHVLGWPDFYATSYSGAKGTEKYSLMCMGPYNNDSRTPPALNILERWMVGWAEPEEFATSKTYEIPPITDNKGYMMPTGNTNEYFLAEYRGAGKNVWDTASYMGANASGMIVYHVDYTPDFMSRWLDDNTVNNDPYHECMKLVRSDPSASMSTIPPSRTLFPGANQVTELNKSNSHYNVWKTPEGNVIDIPVLLKNITIDKAAGCVKVDVERMGGPGLNFKAQTYQTELLLTWEDPKLQSWTVSWADSKGVKIGEQVVSKPELLISSLQPATSYRVTIAGKPAEGEAWEQTYTVTTEARKGSNARIGFKTTEFTKETPILLTLMDYQGTYKEVQWFVDNTKTTEKYITLSAGAHTIKAVVIRNDNSKEIMIKYITVK